MRRKFNVYSEGTKYTCATKQEAEALLKELRAQGKSAICPAIEAKTGIRF